MGMELQGKRPLRGHDPYSSSKACAELVTSAYRDSYFSEKRRVGVASARAGNVIGGGDWSDDRLIPDIIRAFESGKALQIRSPNATRPWQHVLEPVSGYMSLVERLVESPNRWSEAWNFGPEAEDVQPVSWIVDRMAQLWDEVSWRIDESDNVHEAHNLSLDISKAKLLMDWHPRWKLAKALSAIITWHERYSLGHDMSSVCLEQIRRILQSGRVLD